MPLKGETVKQGAPAANMDKLKYCSKQARLEDGYREPPRCPNSKDGIAFPWRLHELLEAAQHEGFEHIVGWMPGGKAFRVHDKELFEQRVLPTYMSSMTRYKSFTRQLNLYCFDRVLSGADRGSYRHSLFVRGHKSLCNEMSLTKVKGVNRTLSRELIAALLSSSLSSSSPPPPSSAGAPTVTPSPSQTTVFLSMQSPSTESATSSSSSTTTMTATMNGVWPEQKPRPSPIRLTSEDLHRNIVHEACLVDDGNRSTTVDPADAIIAKAILQSAVVSGDRDNGDDCTGNSREHASEAESDVRDTNTAIRMHGWNDRPSLCPNTGGSANSSPGYAREGADDVDDHSVSSCKPALADTVCSLHVVPNEHYRTYRRPPSCDCAMRREVCSMSSELLPSMSKVVKTTMLHTSWVPSESNRQGHGNSVNGNSVAGGSEKTEAAPSVVNQNRIGTMPDWMDLRHIDEKMYIDDNLGTDSFNTNDDRRKDAVHGSRSVDNNGPSDDMAATVKSDDTHLSHASMLQGPALRIFDGEDDECADVACNDLAG